MAKMNKALDEVRAGEARKIAADGGQPVLKRSRWCLLKRRGNLTGNQQGRLRELMRYNLRTVRAYLLKEDFQQFWEYRSAGWAGKFLDRWCTDALRSRIKPMKKIAYMLRSHRALILNWFKAKGQISNGVVEGLNNKAKLTMRKSYGFKSPTILEIALLHALGKLPEPKLAPILVDGAKFFNRLGTRVDRQIRDQLPVDLVTIAGLPSLGRVKHSKFQRWKAALFIQRRQDADAPVFELQERGAWLAFAVLDFYSMKPFALDLGHFSSNGVITVAGQAIHASADQKVSPLRLCRAEQLIDIRPAISNMNASSRIAQQVRGLAQILDPADAFFLIDWHARGIDMALQLLRPLELLARPKLYRREPQRQAFRRDGEAPMHQHSAHRIVLRPDLAARIGDAGTSLPHGLNVVSLERKFGGVVQHQNRTVCRRQTLSRGLKMAGEDLRFIHSVVIEKSIRRFGVRPVLTRERNTLSRRATHLFEQRAKAASQSLILEIALRELCIYPRARGSCFGNSRPAAPLHVSIRHAAPCEKSTRTTHISNSRNICNNYL